MIKYYALIGILILSSCAAMRDDVCRLIPAPPLSCLDAPLEEVKMAKEIETPEPPKVVLDEKLSLCDILSISMLFQLKSSRALAAAKSVGFTYKSSLAPYYPTINGSVDYLIDDFRLKPRSSDNEIVEIEDNSNNGTFKSYNESIVLNYLLLDFGGRDATANAAWHDFQSLGYLYSQSVQNLLIDSLHAYFDYINAFESKLVAISNLQMATDSYKLVKMLFDAKYANVFDVEHLRTAMIQQEITVQTLEGRTLVTHGALATAMGINTSTPFETEPLHLEDFPLSLAEDVEGLMHAALILKPALSAFKEEFLRRRAEVDIARSAGMPNVVMQARSSHTHFMNGPTRSINESTLQFTLNVPIFQGFFFTNQIRRAKADRDFALFDWKLQEEAVMLDVWSNYFDFLTAKANVENAHRLIESTTAAFNSALELYKLRFIGTQDLLSAQDDLANSRLFLVQTNINMASSLSSLAYSIGILVPNICKGYNNG